VRDDAVRPLLVAAPLLVQSRPSSGDAPPAGVEPLGRRRPARRPCTPPARAADARPTVILAEDLHNAPEALLFLASRSRPPAGR
jgi:hypothetical protein